MENEEVKDLAVVEESKVMNLSDYRKASNTQVGTFSNIHDSKELFNLSSHVDFKLNDVVGEKIRVKKVLVRKFEKPLDEPIVNEETGEIKSYEYKVSCVLVDDNGKSYATGSKIFANLLISYLIDNGGINDLTKDGIEIQIVKNPLENGRSSLGFIVL